jgi:hypothetical protein
MSSNHRYWPFDVPPPQQRAASGTGLIALLETAYAAGYSAYVNESETLIGFGDPQRRAVEYVLRSSGDRYWEPLLADHGNGIRLGPIFGLSESASVVFEGFGDLTTFTMRWLRGVPLENAIEGLSVFDRTHARTPLRRVAGIAPNSPRPQSGSPLGDAGRGKRVN